MLLGKRTTHEKNKYTTILGYMYENYTSLPFFAIIIMCISCTWQMQAET